MITADDLRSRRTLWKPVHTPDAASGEMITTYALVATVWAAVETQGGRRFEEAKKFNAETEELVVIRYRTDAKADWMLGDTHAPYEQILFLSDYKELHREIWINCKRALG
jgi:SPP1 family predicted phage head-tail adaptor